MSSTNTSLAMMLVAVLAVAVLTFLLLVLVGLRRRNRTVADQPGLWDGRNRGCPDCGAIMEQGWVMLGRGAIWSPRARGRPGPFAHIGQALPNTISLSFRPAANMAWRCERCRLLLVDHDKLVG